MLRKFRMFSQIFFFILFTINFYFLLHKSFAFTFDTTWFQKLNPLTGILVSLSNRSILFSYLFFASIVLVITLIFGRVFCGFFCPLGTSIDFVDKLIWKKRDTHRLNSFPFHNVKYVLLITISLGAMLGVLSPLFFDPTSLITRIFTLIIYPFTQTSSYAVISASKTLGFDWFAFTHISVPLFYGIAFTVFLSILIYGGGYFDHRFWCQNICPTGAFFGLLSAVPIFRRVINNDKCNGCSICYRACPTHAIDTQKPFLTNASECIVCGNCVKLDKACGNFKFHFGSIQNQQYINLERRHVFLGIAGGLSLFPIYKAAGTNKRDDSGRLIRPPGSIPEKSFLAKCIACGQCMRACPTNALQPSVFSDGFNRLYTPKAVPRIAGCEEKCTLCGYVCPTGAISKLTVEDKQYVRMGTAVIDRNRCVAWEQNKECLVCDEVCPYNAIEAKIVETTTGKFKVPIIYEERCVGCGMCEQHCPVFDMAAIVVYRFGETRKYQRPYVTSEQKISIDEARRRSDSAFMHHVDENEVKIKKVIKNSETNPYPDVAPESNGNSGLPAGFE